MAPAKRSSHSHSRRLVEAGVIVSTRFLFVSGKLLEDPFVEFLELFAY
jgi:hypothetical protein